MIVSIPDDNENENNKNENDTTVWKSFCFLIDKSFCQYIVKICIIISLMIYSAYNLMRDDLDCPQKNYYSSILSLLFGVIIPNPRIGR